MWPAATVASHFQLHHPRQAKMHNRLWHATNPHFAPPQSRQPTENQKPALQASGRFQPSDPHFPCQRSRFASATSWSSQPSTTTTSLLSSTRNSPRASRSPWLMAAGKRLAQMITEQNSGTDKRCCTSVGRRTFPGTKNLKPLTTEGAEHRETRTQKKQTNLDRSIQPSFDVGNSTHHWRRANYRHVLSTFDPAHGNGSGRRTLFRLTTTPTPWTPLTDRSKTSLRLFRLAHSMSLP